MATPTKTGRLLSDRLFRTGLVSTVLAVLVCLSTHILAFLGVVGAVAWFSTLEHAAVVAVFAFAALTAYAVYRHRRCASCAHDARATGASRRI